MTTNLSPAVSVPMAAADPSLATDRVRLSARYLEVRGVTESLCAPLETEDYVVQSMPETSPAKWHLAHTSWFFKTMVLTPAGASVGSESNLYSYLFNSYYDSLGERMTRSERGLLARPTVAEVYRYRAAVDAEILRFLEQAGDEMFRRLGATVVLGLHHEQQHQELILTDLKHLFSRNPLRPVYREQEPIIDSAGPVAQGWATRSGGLRRIGHEGDGFAFDNEGPRHTVHLEAYHLAGRLVTNGEYLAFMAAGGYARPELWLSDGWNARQVGRWVAPLYWEESAAGWRIMTLAGMRHLVASEPVCHVSFYEADAYARWAGARLPTEAEWEVAAAEASAAGTATAGNFLETERFHTAPGSSTPIADLSLPEQLFGDVWEWTQSPYTPYPGYRPVPGALGEYNGKFMCNQYVLRGGSCITSRTHIRSTYRNFFPPDTRWQFSGIRLAQDA